MRMRIALLVSVTLGLTVASLAQAEDWGWAVPKPDPEAGPEKAEPAESAATTDWPRFHGPNVDNKSPDTGLLKQWPEDGPKLLKSVSGMGQGFSCPAISGGMIYVTGVVGGNQQIKVLDMDGKEKWTVTNGPGWTGSYPGSRSTPTIVDGVLYVLSGQGQVGIFDAKTGKEKGKMQVRDTFGGKNPTWGYSENLLIDGDLLICTPGGRGAAVVAYSIKTGKLAWKTSDSSARAAYCAPIAFDLNGSRQIATMTATEALGINAKTGSVLWRFPNVNRYKVMATPMIFRGGKIYGTSNYGTGGFLLDISRASGGRKLSAEWIDKNLDNHHGGCVMLDGHIYGCSSRGQWVCLEFATGEVKYKTRGVGKGSLTYADGMLYCLGERGTMGLVKADPKEHNVVSQFRVPKGGGGAYWAHPVVLGGRMYLRHADRLFIYDVKAS